MKVYCKATNFGKGRPGWNRSIQCEGGRYAGVISYPCVSGRGVSTGVFEGVNIPEILKRFPQNGEVEISVDELAQISEECGGKPTILTQKEGKNVNLYWIKGEWK